MEKELQMMQITAEIENTSSIHYLVSLLGFQSFKKLVNVGGSDVMDVQGRACYLSFTEGINIGRGKQ